MATVEDYLNLITSEHRDKPNFVATVSIGASFSVQVQDVLKSLIIKLDLDTAVGDQLDILGEWIGISRNVSIPVTDVNFSWDGGEFLGWDYGAWQDTLQPVTITTLPDDTYRTLLRSKIAANRWDGTTENAYFIWSEVFPTLTILIIDKLNMSYKLALIGEIIDSLTLALIRGGYVKLKPEGVRLTDVYASVNTGPLFAWDIESEYVAGWDSGSWPRELPVT